MTILDRQGTSRGELALRRVGDDFEVISGGVFLMSTASGGPSERLLVRATLAAAAARDRVLVGGLGVGFSLVEALVDPAVQEVTVVEIEQAVVDWHRTHLRAFSEGALDDPRVRLVVGDLVEVVGRSGSRFDALCLDVDNGPDWTVTPANAVLYGSDGLDLLASALNPGGALGVWSAAAAPAFVERLRARFTHVEDHAVAVPRGEPDRVYVACRPR